MQMQIILIIIAIRDWRELRKSPGLWGKVENPLHATIQLAYRHQSPRRLAGASALNPSGPLLLTVGTEPCSGYSSPLSLSVSRLRRRTQLRARTNARQYDDRQDTRYDDKQSGDSTVLVSTANCISVKMRRKGFESERSQQQSCR